MIEKRDRAFIVLLFICSAMVAGIVTENIRSASLTVSPKVDVKKVRAGIERAGLLPYEAKYWKVINQ